MKVMIENKGPLPVAVGEQTILPGERTTLEGDGVIMLEETGAETPPAEPELYSTERVGNEVAAARGLNEALSEKAKRTV
jgi:hypothetical protein